jgi:transposase InsO family protein
VAKKKRKPKAEEPNKRKGLVPFEVRVRIVQAVMRGTKQADAAVAFGVSVALITKLMAAFQSGGIEALRPKLHDGGAATKRTKRAAKAQAARTGVVAVRDANPEFGTRRIRDVLARFEGLGVPESTVRRILHEEGLIEERAYEAPREKPVRRFERAEPNQLWQTDIFTFELRRHQRVYLVGFMDDYSRYLVSWAMAHHQKASLVIEALERGIAEYGEPREVLTDQGRQYAAWRGKTEFQELLRRRGIEHCKSRPQHPETLGKIERFWKTLWEEFLRKTVFADFADGLRRIALFVQHYNFQRTHQGIDGLVPADRFFRAAPHVRAAIETQIKANALRLAQEKEPQKPFYLVGRLGDQDLSIAATGGALRVQLGDAAQTIPMNQETNHETKATRTFHDEEVVTTDDPAAAREARRSLADAARAQPREGVSSEALTLAEDNDEEADEQAEVDVGSPTSATLSGDATLAEWTDGSRSGRAATDDDDPLGALWAYARDHGDCRPWDLPTALLPTGDQGSRRDDAGIGARSERGGESRRRDAGEADQRARRPRHSARAGESSTGAPALHGEEGAADRTDRDAGETRPEAGPAIDERWARTFAALEESDDECEPESDFDVDEGWRSRVVKWDRKLAGADASVDGEDDGESTPTERTLELRSPTDGATGAPETLRRDSIGAGESADDQRRGGGTWDCAREHADAGAPSGGGDRGGAATEADGSCAQVGCAEAARAADQGEREAESPAPGGGRHDDGSGGDHPAPPRDATIVTTVAVDEVIEVAEGEAGGRTGTSEADDIDDRWASPGASGEEV